MKSTRQVWKRPSATGSLGPDSKRQRQANGAQWKRPRPRALIPLKVRAGSATWSFSELGSASAASSSASAGSAASSSFSSSSSSSSASASKPSYRNSMVSRHSSLFSSSCVVDRPSLFFVGRDPLSFLHLDQYIHKGHTLRVLHRVFLNAPEECHPFRLPSDFRTHGEEAGPG